MWEIGPQRQAEPSGPAFGQQSGYSPAPDRAPGHGQSRRDGPGPQGPQGPQMSAGRPQPADAFSRETPAKNSVSPEPLQQVFTAKAEDLA